MANENTGDNEFDGSELVSSLMAEAPSEPFVLERIKPDGTRREFGLRLQLLRSEEEIGCLSRAQEVAKSYGELRSSGYDDIYKEAQLAELLAKALRRPKKITRKDGTEYYPQLFVDAKQLRESFGSHELALGINAYEVTKARFSCLAEFSPDELDKWAARLSSALLGPFFLQRLDSSHWPALLTALALEVKALRDEVSRPLPTLQESSGYTPGLSPSGTGGSGSSSAASLTDSTGQSIPSDHPVRGSEAARLAKSLRSNKKKP